MSIMDVYRVGGVRRWHTNWAMSHVVDTMDAHQRRVWALIKKLNPSASRALLEYALTHDDGEYGLGADFSGPAKQGLPHHIRAELDRIETAARERIWGPDPDLTPHEDLWFHFADGLDPYIMASRHAPHTLSTEDWPERRDWLSNMAAQLIEDNEAEQEVQRMLWLGTTGRSRRPRSNVIRNDNFTEV